MQIKRLRLSGFKSFVDAADLRIEPGLTGVVGPNGCGKSNLLEALRWTMGESSAKSLRGAGMDDVIFAGTATRPARDFAEVSILAEIDGQETEVVRRIERGAGSAYRIDGRDVRAKDVGLLFADAATGAHSPALVSQGRISAVIAAKPTERRAMLEEAAGIAGLHVRRRDAEQKLRATEANLLRLDEVIADQDSRAAALKRQARAAERYRALSEQIRLAEAQMIFARWRDAAKAADLAKAEAKTAEDEVHKAAELQRATAAHQSAATDSLATARAASLTARDAATDAGHRLATLRTERDGVARRIAEMAQARTRIADDRAREGALAHDAAEALTRLASEIKALDGRIVDAQARAPALETALAEAERTARDAEVALAQALAAQAGEAADVRVAQAALAAARTRAERSARDATQIEAERTRLGTTTPLEAERDTAASARLVATDQAARAREAIAAAEADERAAIDSRDRKDRARADARAELSAIESEAAALTRATPAARDRLLDRIRVEVGYERAVAAALGDDLDAGLDPGADRYWAGAEPLPGDPAGPAEAVPLGSHISAPEGLARRLAQVFVANEDGGQPLAVGQRLVTRTGLLRRWDGFVARSGGAAAAERLERVNRLAALEAQRPAALDAVARAAAEFAAVEAAILTTRGAGKTARAALERADTNARDATRAEDRATAAIERLAGQRGDLDARAQRIAGDVVDAQAEMDRARTAVTALPDGSATTARVAVLQREAENCRTSVAQARAERSALDRAVASDRERLAAAQADAKSWKARAGEAARRIADMDARETELAREADAIAAKPALLDTAIASIEETHAAARADAETALAAERIAQEQLRTAEEAGRIAGEALAQAREARAGALARTENQEQRRVEMGRVSGERFQCPAPVLPERIGFSAGEVGTPQDESTRHERLSLDRERIGPVNLVAETELAQLEAGSLSNAAEREELGLAVNRLRGSIGNLNREGRQRLLAAFEAVNGHFIRLFTTLFDGGQAHLQLIDSDDPLEAGLEILAQPPGKRLQSLTLLSGGEQALTAVALIFGLFLTNPAPICVLDEVDAPLDDANIERFCDLLDRMREDTRTRYLVVTHNAVTMSRMDRLFGVTMVERGVSRLVSVDLSAAETLLAAE